MEMVSITEGMTMSNISFDSVSNSAPANALQGVGTNALVDNPFTFEPVAEATSAHALQGCGHQRPRRQPVQLPELKPSLIRTVFDGLICR